MATVVFVAHGLSRDNVRLQPWRYIFEIARHKSAAHTVYIITNVASSSDWEDGFRLLAIQDLRPTRQRKLLRLIDSLAPDEVWWSTTPRTIAYWPILRKLRCRIVAFITCPIYRWSEVLRAVRAGVTYQEIRALAVQNLVPHRLFRALLNSSAVSAVVVQSARNSRTLAVMGVDRDRLHLVPVGIDDEDARALRHEVVDDVAYAHSIDTDEVVFLYLGALRAIRGFNTLLSAFPAVAARDRRVRLIVLARGADADTCERWRRNRLANCAERVEFVTGWLERQQVRAYLELASVVVLPFALVPSDVPIAVLEALARGTPVIVSDVDGLPELAEGHGIVVNPVDTGALASAMLTIASNGELRNKYGTEALAFMADYPRWPDVGAASDEVSATTQRTA